MPRTLPAQLTAALESGSYDPFFRVTITDTRDNSTVTHDVTSYKLKDLELTFEVQTLAYLEYSTIYHRATLTRGIVQSGVEYGIDSSLFYIQEIKWTGIYQSFTCNIFPKQYYTSAGDLTYRQVIDAFCANYGRTAIYYDNAAAWLSYQFLPTGRNVTLTNAQKFFSLLRQKYFIFATDNGNDEVLFFTAFDQAASADYSIDSYKFDVSFNENIKRKYIWRDENNTTHGTDAQMYLIKPIQSGTYTQGLARITNQIYLVGTGQAVAKIFYTHDQFNTITEAALPPIHTGKSVDNFVKIDDAIILAGCMGTTGEIWRSTDAGATWSRVHQMDATETLVYGMCYIGAGVCLTAGKNKIYRSTNYGATWAYLSTIPGASDQITNLSHISGDIVMVSAYLPNKIYRSTDAGATWSAAVADYRISRDMAIITQSGEILAASPSGLLYSNDAGLTFSVRNATPLVYLYVSPSQIYYAINTSGEIRSSIDAGVTWTLIATIPNINYLAYKIDETFFTDKTLDMNSNLWEYNAENAQIYPVHNLGFLPSTALAPTRNTQKEKPTFAPFPMHLKYLSSDRMTVNLFPSTETYNLERAEVTEVLDLKAAIAWHIEITNIQFLSNTEGGALPSTIEASAPYTPLNVSNFANTLSAADNNIQAAMDTIDDHSHTGTMTPLDTTNFNGILSAADNNIQAAMDTLDNHSHGGVADAPSDSVYYGRRNSVWTNLKTYFDTLYAAITHNHSGTYEPANANIQSHIASSPATTAANDFQVGNGAGAWIKKTLAETKTIIGGSSDYEARQRSWIL